MWGKLKLNFQPAKYQHHLRKHYNNLQCFVRKYTTIILNQLNIKKKFNKDNFDKYKKKRKEKKHLGKHYNNLQCFMRKFTVIIFNQLNIKNNKNDKDYLKTKHKKKKKHIEKTVAINDVLRKKS